MSLTYTDTLLTKLGQTLHNAQALSAKVYRNGLETSLAVGINQLNTGTYSYTLPLPVDWLPADVVSVHFTYVVNHFNPTTTKINLGSVLSLRAVDVPDQIAQDIASQAAALLVDSTATELRALAAEIAANHTGSANSVEAANATGGFKKLSATGRITKIEGATIV